MSARPHVVMGRSSLTFALGIRDALAEARLSKASLWWSEWPKASGTVRRYGLGGRVSLGMGFAISNAQISQSLPPSQLPTTYESGWTTLGYFSNTKSVCVSQQ